MSSSNRFKPGDHLRVPRELGAYTHHGIYVGGKRPIIHYSGDLTHKCNASIRRATLRQFSQGADISVVRYSKCLPSNATVERAESRLGENGYNLFSNNCEHFARWCKTEQHKSEQVKDKSAGTAGGVGTGVGTAAGMGVVSGAGAAAGLSGPGIMSGLASVGSTVGGGAVAGVAVLAAAPALASTATMHKVLEHDEHASSEENEARKYGRHAAGVGAAGASAATVAAISSSGTVAGLSGAGITSGLAAIGGGSMAVGTAAAVAAPAVAAAAVSYGVYRGWKWLMS